MRSRRIILISVCLLLAAGAWLLQSHRNGRNGSLSRPHKAAGPTVAQTTPLTFLSTNNPKTAVAARAKAYQFRFRLANTAKTIGELTGDPHAILLANALIDTGAKLDLAIPKNLRAQAEPGAYIIQANGPIDNAFRALLAAAGAQIVSYIPNNAYLVMISASGAYSIASEGFSVIPYEPYYKLSPSLLAAVANNQPAGELKVAAFPGTADATKTALAKIGVTVVAEETTPLGPFFVLQNVSDVAAVAQIPTVHIVEPSYKRVPANDLSRATVGVATDTQTTNNYMNLSGANVLVEVNDSGIDQTHPDLLNRVSADLPTSLVDTDGHGTHVAGIIAGDGTESMTVSNVPGSIIGTNGFAAAGQFRGMAPAANLISVASLGGDTNATSDRYLQETPAQRNALISNNSWNYDGDNDYDLAAASYDAAVRDALAQVPGSQPVLFVFSAGNDGNGDDTTSSGSGTPDSIESPATAKNVITVGALQEFRNIGVQVTNVTGTNVTVSTPWKDETSTDSRVAGFSGRGNVGIQTEGTYGRFKPDVVAPGTFIVSTRSSQWDIGTFFFASPTNISVVDKSVAPINPNALGADEFPPVPTNAVQATIQLLPNGDSPVPFPNLPIYFGLLSSATYDQVTFNNQVSIPPDGGLTIADIVNTEPLSYGLYGFNYAISNNTAEPITFDVLLEIYSTNNPGNEQLVLSNLNQVIGTPNPNSTGPGPYYRYETGTSMSAADVSGVLALMQDYFTNTLQTTPSPALLKAMLINGARPTQDYNLLVQNNNNMEGWGLINLPDSLPPGVTNQINAACSSFFIDQSPTNALATGDSHTFLVSVNTTNGAQALPLRVTLTWTDPPGDPAAAIKLVNNLDLVVTNLDDPANPVIFYGNDIGASSSFPFNTPEDTNTPPIFDTINNVQNVFIDNPLGTNYSITVLGHGVNVNAVTAQTNNVVQDFALVISCGEGEVTNAITVTDNGIVSNPTGSQQISFLVATNAPLLNQFVGASSPLLGTNTIPAGTNFGFATNAILTLGQTNQWHFYVITNPPGTNLPNAAFITFLPDTLSIPRMGVFADSTANATRPEADIDLYVTTDSGLTNLDPVTISNCVNGTQVGATVTGVFNGASLSRGGTEFVADTNSQPGEIYYIGVQSEDQMASEYDFLPIFSAQQFSTMQNGVQTVYGQLLPVNIPDGSPKHPGIAYIFGLAIYPMTVNQVIPYDSIVHTNYGDLIGTLNHNDIRTVLNNHDEFSGAPGPYTFSYDDFPGSTNRASDGPGSLINYAGTEGIGPWLLVEADTHPTQAGYVSNYSLTISPHQNAGNGIYIALQPGQSYRDYIDAPAGYTSFTVFATNLPPTSAQSAMQLYVEPIPNVIPPLPPATDTNELRADLTNCLPGTGPYPTGTDPGNSLTVGPPLTPGRYWYVVYNPLGNPTISTGTTNLYILVKLNYSSSAISTVDYRSSGPVPILDDAVSSSIINVPDPRTIQDFNVGLRVDHPRISDCVFHLITPDGTRYLLMENRGGDTTNGCGVTITNSFFAPASSSGSWQPSTNVIDTGVSAGTVTVTYNFFPVPDQMEIFYEGTVRTNFTTSGPGQFNLSYGPGTSTQITVVMNPNGNPNQATYWTYTVSGSETRFLYLAFTENTNLTTTPIKFAPPPFVPEYYTTNFGLGDFDFAAPTNYVAPTNVAGWGVTASQVSVVYDPSNAPAGSSNFLALALGTIITNLPTTPGVTYTLTYDYRGPGIVSWWRGEGNTNDELGINNGIGGPGLGYGPGEVGQGFVFNNSDAYVKISNSVSLDVGPGGGFTLEAWIKPADVINTAHPIFEWNGITNEFQPEPIPGVFMWIKPYGVLCANLVDIGGVQHPFQTVPYAITNALTSGGFQHVALTYSRATGLAILYTNGVAAVSTNLGTAIVPQTSLTLWLGFSPFNRFMSSAGPDAFFDGTIDEPSVYNRALSASEIKAINDLGSNGKFFNSIEVSAPENLAVASVTIPGVGTSVIYGNNTTWQAGGATFTAAWPQTPVIISGIEPGILLDSFNLSGAYGGNLYYQPEQDISGINHTPANGTSGTGIWTLEIQDDRAGDAGTLLGWQMEFVFANTNFIPGLPTLIGGQPQTNVIPPGGFAYFAVPVPTNADIATNILLFSTGPVNLWFNPTNPPVGASPPDFLLMGSALSGVSILTTTSVPTNIVPGGTYYLGVQNPNTYTVTNAIEVDFHYLAVTNPPIVISGIVATNIGGRFGFLLTWYAPTNDIFLVQWTGNLNPPVTWRTFTNVITYTGPPPPVTNGIGLFRFFDDGSQTGGFDTMRFYRVLLIGRELINGQTYTIAPGAVDFFLVNVPTNADFATNRLLFATGPLNAWLDTNTPPTTNVFLFSGTSGSYTLSTTGAPPLVPGGFYWFGVQNTNTFTVTYAVAVDFHLLLPTTNLPIVFSGIVYTNIGGTNGFLLTWYAPTNDIFLVQWTGSLNPPVTWNTFTNIITYTGPPPPPTNGIGLFRFFDDGSQTGGFDTMRFYRLLLVGSLASGLPQTNSVAAGGLDYFLVNVPTNADFATNTLLFAGAPVNVWFATNLPPATNNFLFSGTNGAYTLSTTGVPPLVPGGTYWLVVQNTNSFTVTYGLEVNFHLAAANIPITISTITFTNRNGTNGFLLTWFAPTNDVFQVQWSDTLLPANWQFFTNFIYYTGPPTPTNGLFSFFDDGSQTPPGLPPMRFYRIILAGSGTSTHTNIVFISSVTSTNITGTNGFRLTWSAPTNYLFELQWTTNLMPVITWHTFPNIIAYSTFVSPTNSLFNFFDNGAQGGLGPLKFYRLLLLP
jgi:subtilisin-like proprotein convertase family protein